MVAGSGILISNAVPVRLESLGYQAKSFDSSRQVFGLLAQTKNTVGLMDIESLYTNDVDVAGVCDPKGELSNRVLAIQMPSTPDHLLHHVRYDVIPMLGGPRSFSIRIARKLSSKGYAPACDTVSAGALRVSRAMGLAWWRRREVALSAVESQILWQLVAAAGEVVAKKVLQAASALPDQDALSASSLATYIMRISQKLSAVGWGGKFEAIRGVGYSCRV